MEGFLSGSLDHVPSITMLASVSFIFPNICIFRGSEIRFVMPIFLAPSILDFEKHSLVGANTGSFESLGTQLFVLVGDHVDAERELVDICTLSAEIEDTNLRVWYTTVESGLWVRLEA